MPLIQTILRCAAPALAITALFAAAPANADEAEKKDALVDFASCSKPQYPAAAIKEKRTGTVKLGYLITVEGTVEASMVEKTSGHGDLDLAAHDAIKLCKFVPATRNGKPKKEWMHVQYVWVLE